MTRKRCKRRTAPNSSAWLNAIGNSQPTQPAEVQRIMLVLRLAYEKLKAGHGGADDFDRIGAMVNVGLVRSEAIGEVAVDAFKAAGDSILECDRLWRHHGKPGFTGPHIVAMNEALDLYEQVLGMSSPSQMHAAALESCRRIRQGHVIQT